MVGEDRYYIDTKQNWWCHGVQDNVLYNNKINEDSIEKFVEECIVFEKLKGGSENDRKRKRLTMSGKRWYYTKGDTMLKIVNRSK